jgi:SAM-dependent methyltransferase
MHGSVMGFVEKMVLPEMIEGKLVIEAGSLDVNGSVREIIMKHRPAKYLGIDIREGRGVDRVLSLYEAPKELSLKYDLVICTEVLEHLEDWRAGIDALKDLMSKDGVLVITTRAPGFPRHEEPNDYWRYTPTDFSIIFADMDNLIFPDPEAPGVFMIAKGKPQQNRVPLNMCAVASAPTE